METTRRCADCGQSKTIQGVWYFQPTSPSARFVCESCFRTPLVATGT